MATKPTDTQMRESLLDAIEKALEICTLVAEPNLSAEAFGWAFDQADLDSPDDLEVLGAIATWFVMAFMQVNGGKVVLLDDSGAEATTIYPVAVPS